MTQPRVLVAHCRYRQPGGEDVVANAEIDLLRDHGNAVFALVRSNDDIETINPASLVTQTLWSRRTTHEMANAIQEFRPDIVHVHNTFPLLSPSLYWAAAKANIPIVQTLHNFRLLCAQAMLLRDGKICEACLGGIPWRGVLRRCYRDSAAQSAVLVSSLALHKMLGTYRDKVTRYIALNRFCRDKFIEGGLPAEKFLIKPNFVADIGFQGNEERQGGLFVGRLSVEKGVDVLRNAIAVLNNGMASHKCHVDVIGAGPEESGMKGQAGLMLSGWQEQSVIHSRMRAAAYLVTPSIWYENFPRVIVEAFACGLPIIASRLGAMAELIEDGYTGLLFEPGNAGALAQKLAWAEDNRNAMLQMGLNARRTYEMNYTPERNYQQLIEIYDEAIHAARSKQAA